MATVAFGQEATFTAIVVMIAHLSLRLNHLWTVGVFHQTVANIFLYQSTLGIALKIFPFVTPSVL